MKNIFLLTSITLQTIAFSSCATIRHYQENNYDKNGRYVVTGNTIDLLTPDSISNDAFIYEHKLERVKRIYAKCYSARAELERNLSNLNTQSNMINISSMILAGSGPLLFAISPSQDRVANIAIVSVPPALAMALQAYVAGMKLNENILEIEGGIKEIDESLDGATNVINNARKNNLFNVMEELKKVKFVQLYESLLPSTGTPLPTSEHQEIIDIIEENLNLMNVIESGKDIGGSQKAKIEIKDYEKLIHASRKMHGSLTSLRDSIVPGLINAEDYEKYLELYNNLKHAVGNLNFTSGNDVDFANKVRLDSGSLFNSIEKGISFNKSQVISLVSKFFGKYGMGATQPLIDFNNKIAANKQNDSKEFIEARNAMSNYFGEIELNNSYNLAVQESEIDKELDKLAKICDSVVDVDVPRLEDTYKANKSN